MQKEYLTMVDMDGTLFDTVDVNYYAYKEALNKVGIELGREYFKEKCFAHNYREFLGIMIKDEEMIEEIHNYKKKLYLKYLCKTRKNDALIMILDSLKTNSYIALVTTASKENTMQLLSYFDMEDFFDEIVTQEDVKIVKPNPQCYKIVMDRYNIMPQKCIIFEDSVVGIEAAKNVCKTIMKVEAF
jgi:beta-phosphoglucomutase